MASPRQQLATPLHTRTGKNQDKLRTTVYPNTQRCNSQFLNLGSINKHRKYACKDNSQSSNKIEPMAQIRPATNTGSTHAKIFSNPQTRLSGWHKLATTCRFKSLEFVWRRSRLHSEKQCQSSAKESDPNLIKSD